MVKVEFTSQNGKSCICGRCPVETKSLCSKGKMAKAMEEMKKKKMPKTQDTPVLYCSHGAAACKDMNMNEMCICGDCPVFMENALENGMPSGYYCKDGKAR